MKEQITEIISDGLKALGAQDVSFTVEHPAELSHGDFSTNAALIAGKKLGTNPVEFALSLVEEIGKNQPKEIEKVEVAGPGFINFYISASYFSEHIGGILKAGEKYGRNASLKGKKIIVEYTDPNTFKEFHIGHLMSNTIGEALARIIEWNGAKVVRACYQSDVGLNIAKAIWGMTAHLKHKPEKSAPLSDKVAFLGKAYALGSQSYEESEDAKKEMDALNKVIFEKSDKKVNELYDWGKEVSLEHFEEIYKVLGTKFDYNFFESEVYKTGLKIVEEFLEKGIFEQSEGAVIFPGEKHGLHTRVFVNKFGLPTYEAKELGLNKIKFDKIDPDLSIIITGNEVNEYFRVLLKVMSLVYPAIAEKTVHLGHGMLRFAEGKMSSRKGNVVTGESLLGDVKNMVEEKIKDRPFDAKEKARVAEEVAVAAIKYTILRQSPGRDIIFDPEQSLSFEGDSGPYLQYSATRAGSVLRKAEEEKLSVSSHIEPSSEPQPWDSLQKMLIRFPEVMERAEKERAPQLLVTYLTELSGLFNSFYGAQKIADAKDPTSPYKLAVTQAFHIVLQNGLAAIGIASPASM